MKLLFLLLALASPVLALETVTEWQFRTVPTSQPIVGCSNGRTPHMKYPVDTWRHCAGSDLTVEKIIGGVKVNEPIHCRGHWRVPIAWCPGPK
jgi:hypothetical protein